MAHKARRCIEHQEDPIYDESAQSHFLEIVGDLWLLDLEKSDQLHKIQQDTAGRFKPRRQLASICEHALISNWLQAESKSRKRRSLLEILPKDERVTLACRAFVMLYNHFSSGGEFGPTPEYAVALGLTGPNPVPHWPVHVGARTALDLFYYTLEGIFNAHGRNWDIDVPNRSEFASMGEAMEDKQTADIDAANEAAVACLPQIIRTYKEYVRLSATRAAPGPSESSRVALMDELLCLTDCTFGPLTMLRVRGYKIESILSAFWGAFRYFLGQGEDSARLLAAYLLINLRRVGEPSFAGEYSEAVSMISEEFGMRPAIEEASGSPTGQSITIAYRSNLMTLGLVGSC